MSKELEKSNIKSDLEAIAKLPPWEVRRALTEYAAKLDEPKEGTRSLTQNKALHLFFDWVATALNDAGMDMRVFLKEGVEVPWDSHNVKERLWKPVMKLQTGKESTTKLSKAEVSQVFETFNRHLANRGVSLSFPSAEKRSEFFEALDIKERLEYPIHQDPSF